MSESFAFAAETIACSLGEWIVARKPTLRSSLCRAEDSVEIAWKASWVGEKKRGGKFGEIEDGRFRDLIPARQKVSKGEGGLEDVYCPSE